MGTAAPITLEVANRVLGVLATHAGTPVPLVRLIESELPIYHHRAKDIARFLLEAGAIVVDGNGRYSVAKTRLTAQEVAGAHELLKEIAQLMHAKTWWQGLGLTRRRGTFWRLSEKPGLTGACAVVIGQFTIKASSPLDYKAAVTPDGDGRLPSWLSKMLDSEGMISVLQLRQLFEARRAQRTVN